tara:strand:- start:1668 stop:2126 length:459 start_codon:yes stop_codon:yes gene_type:complete
MTGFPILTVASTLFSVADKISTGRSQAKAANYNRDIAARNAAATIRAAEESAKRHKRVAAKHQGTLRSLNPNALDLLEDTAAQLKLTELDIIHKGAVDAAGYEGTAGLNRLKAKTYRTASYVGAGSALLLGGAKAYPDKLDSLLSSPKKKVS